MLDCFGKYNIHRFMNLLSRLGVPHAVIHDEDNGNGENAELNQLIQDSRHALLTLQIGVVAGDLETMLGVPKTSPHRKPQHVLYLYEQGSIEAAKVTSFCELVDNCLPAVAN